MDRVFVSIDTSTYWMHATGGGGEDYDSVIFRDHSGFPALKGRHVRGLLREAARRLESWGHVPQDWDPGKMGSLTKWLFGKRGDRLAPPGILDFPTVFHMPEPVLSLGEEYAPLFSTGIASTRIEYETGSAKDQSLRNMEAAVPGLLGGWIGFDPPDRLALAHEEEREELQKTIDEARKIWVDFLQQAALEVRAIGGKRTRGFGRCLMQIGDQMTQTAIEGETA